MASLVPSCISYDPTFSYEVAVIMQEALERMYVREEDVFYYITTMNESYHHPAMPNNSKEGILKGMYLLQKAKKKVDITLLGSGSILLEIIKAAGYLSEHYNINANVWSVTSFNELKREAISQAISCNQLRLPFH